MYSPNVKKDSLGCFHFIPSFWGRKEIPVHGNFEDYCTCLQKWTQLITVWLIKASSINRSSLVMPKALLPLGSTIQWSTLWPRSPRAGWWSHPLGHRWPSCYFPLAVRQVWHRKAGGQLSIPSTHPHFCHLHSSASVPISMHQRARFEYLENSWWKVCKIDLLDNLFSFMTTLLQRDSRQLRQGVFLPTQRKPALSKTVCTP